MEYEYNSNSRNSRGVSPYDPQPHVPHYRTPSSSSQSPSSLYPKIGRSSPPPARAPPPYYNLSSSAPPPHSSSGAGIRVQIKPQYRITPPPQMLPQMGDIPRSSFQFVFDLERKILAEAEKENQNWIRFDAENLPSRTPETVSSLPSMAPTVDPVVNKYIAAGLSREAVPLAVANFGDNPTKVQEYVNAFSVLKEMGFPSNSVAETLLMYDNDVDKAAAHLL